MAEVGSSVIAKKFIIISNPSDSNTTYMIGEYDNFADAASALNTQQTESTTVSFYIIEAYTAVPNPADS